MKNKANKKIHEYILFLRKKKKLLNKYNNINFKIFLNNNKKYKETIFRFIVFKKLFFYLKNLLKKKIN